MFPLHIHDNYGCWGFAARLAVVCVWTRISSSCSKVTLAAADFATFKRFPIKRFIHALFWRVLFLSPYTWRACKKKPV